MTQDSNVAANHLKLVKKMYHPTSIVIEVQTITDLPHKDGDWSLCVILHGRKQYATPERAAVTNALFFRDVRVEFPFANSGKINFFLGCGRLPVASASFNLATLCGIMKDEVNEVVVLKWESDVETSVKPRLQFTLKPMPPPPETHRESIWGLPIGEVDICTSRAKVTPLFLQKTKSGNPTAPSIWAGMLDASLIPPPQDSIIATPPPTQKAKYANQTPETTDKASSTNHNNNRRDSPPGISPYRNHSYNSYLSDYSVSQWNSSNRAKPTIQPKSCDSKTSRWTTKANEGGLRQKLFGRRKTDGEKLAELAKQNETDPRVSQDFMQRFAHNKA